MTKFYLFSRCLTVLLIFAATTVWSQSKTVSGTVTSSDDGSGLPGVNVLEKGTSNGTVTNADGSFTISVGSDATLTFSFVGYTTQEVVVGSQTNLNVSLLSDVTSLSEVVVIGYGQIEKKDATGALVSLKPSDFNAGVISSPEQLIQGRAAGVQITSSSGEPGSGVNIRIRGTSSVRSGNNPLFVVDGVPLSGDEITSGGSAGSLGTSSARNPLNFLNPNDIASIDILKDASATAIYGSRGANGVVIITTKSGKGAGSLDYSYNLSFSKITKKYDLLDREGYLSAIEGYNGAQAAQDIDRGGSTDWQDEIMRTAITQNHSLSFGGGEKNSNYRFSLGYMDQQGIIKNTGLTRFSTRFNGSRKFIDEKLTIATQITVANTRDKGAPITNNSGFEGDLLGSALKANPTLPVKDDDGNFNQPSTSEPNPAAILAYTKDYTDAIRALGNVSAEYQIVKGLNFKTVYGFDRSFSSRKTALSKDLVVSGVYNNGRLYLSDIQIFNSLWENYFTFDKDLSGTTKLNAVVGYSYQRFSNAGQSFQFTNFNTNDLDIMINNFASANQRPSGDNASGYKAGVVGTNSSNVTDELQSYFGRFNVSFGDKYVVTATLRADGSTKFGGNNKYGYFPSAAFKWRLTEEQFMQGDLFSDLNLRVGYGITGNQEIPHNLYDARTRYSDWSLDNDKNITGGGLNNVSFPNPDLKWESTAQFNAGLDYGLFGGKLRGSIDYYHKNTSDLLIQIQSAQPAVQPFFWTNLDANVINRGTEFVIEGDPIASSKLKWTVIANAAYNYNVVENFSGKINTGAINGQGLSGAYAQRIENGLPLFAWWVRDFYGYDENGITAQGPGSDVQSYHGTAIPKWNVGLTNNFKFGALDLSIFFSGQFGHKVYNNTANAFFTAGSLANGRNTTSDVPSSGENKLNAPDVSTRFLENGSFVRLQNATLGYNVSTKGSFISSLRVFLTGQNLFVITDYSGQDPEVNTNKSIDGVPSLNIDYTSYPRARTFTFGVNASF